MTPVNTLVAIFLEPAKAMAAVKERSMILLPLALLILGTVGLMAWYYSVVDFPWLQDHLIAGMGNIPPEQVAAVKGFMQQGTMTISAIVSTAVIIPCILFLSAVYYLLAAKVIGNELTYGKWFAFSTWASVPTLLMIPLGAIQILSHGNGQLAPELLNPLTLNNLLFGLPLDNAWAGLLNSLNVATIWSLVVSVIGFKVWTRKSTVTSVIVVLLPYVAIYGIWAAFAAMRTAA